MPVENATKVSELVETNPLGSDPIGKGDDHIRLIKKVLKNDVLTNRLNPITLSIMVNDAAIVVDDTLHLKERIVSNGGGGIFYAVTVGTTANVNLPNAANIIVSIASPAICFVLSTSGSETYLKQYGALPTFAEVSNNKALLDIAIANMDFIGGGKVIIESDIEYGYEIGESSTYPNMKSAVNNLQVIDNGIGNGTEVPGFEDGSQIRNFFHTPNVFDGKSDGNGFIVLGDYHPYYAVDNHANLAPAGDPSRTVNDNYRATFFYKMDGIVKWGLGMGVGTGTSIEPDDMLDFRGIINGVPEVTPPIIDLVKWLQISKATTAIAFNSTTFSKLSPYEFSIRPGFSTGNFIIRGTDNDPFLRMFSDNGEFSFRRTSTTLQFKIDGSDYHTVSTGGTAHRFISTGNVDFVFDALAGSRRHSLNNASLDYRWQATDLSTNTMIHTNSGNLTITGAYSPFTGVHFYWSKNLISVGSAVDLLNAIRKTFTVLEQEEIEEIKGVNAVGAMPAVEAHYDDESKVQMPYVEAVKAVKWVKAIPYTPESYLTTTTEGEVAITTTANSKVCAGIVESCELIEGVYVVDVAQVGDNRTANLNGFKTNDSNGVIEAGDILVTSAVAGELMKADEGLTESVVRFKAMAAPDDDNIVYGYFK